MTDAAPPLLRTATGRTTPERTTSERGGASANPSPEFRRWEPPRRTAQQSAQLGVAAMPPPLGSAAMSEEAQAAAKVAAEAAPHIAAGAAGVAAAVLRLATYSGPARPWRAVLADGVVQSLVGYAIAALTLWWTGSVAASVGAGILSGLLGWEVVKRIASSRLQAPPR